MLLLFMCFLLFGIVEISFLSEIAPAFYGLDRAALEYELPPLSFSFDDLEPYLDEATARMHYFEYHAKYVNEVNIILKRWRRNTKGKHASRMSIIDIVRNMSHIPHIYRKDLKNFGSGYINHNLYWSTITPNPLGELRLPTGFIQKAIDSKFGTFLEFKSTFTDMAANYIGSGYVWLCLNHSSRSNPDDFLIIATSNEDTPLNQGLFPILGIDVWEHAYILKWRTKKTKYIENWWFLVDWQQVNDLADWWSRVRLHDEL